MRASALAAVMAAISRAVRLSTSAAGAADRRFLEETLLPALDTDEAIRRMLFVGCIAATRRYPGRATHTEFWTLEPRPRRAPYGARLHIVDKLERLRRHVPPEFFDAIVVNGVFGWGLNRAVDAEVALLACHIALRPGGLLVLGWNDVAPRNRVVPSKLRATKAFTPAAYHSFPPRIRMPGPEQHVFEFYRR